MERTRIPLTIESKQNQPEALTDEQIAGRLNSLVDGAASVITTYEPAPYDPDGHPDRSLSRTQLLSLLIGFCGADTNAPLDNRTHTLIYTDPDSGKSNFQTVAIPDYRQLSPFLLEFDPHDPDRATIWDRVNGTAVTTVKPHARIFGASNHYYSRVGRDLRELPTAAIVSPYSTCAGGCLGCSRGAVRSFHAPENDYVAAHVRQLAEDYDERSWDRADLISVNITTGCQPSEEKELAMMLQLMEEYRRQGFSNARFHVFSYNISSPEAMEQLLDSGAIGFIGTIETMNDQERIRQWGHQKGAVTFAQHLERYKLARSMGFPIVETDYVLGADSYSEMLEGIHILDENGVAVVPNIKRNYTTAQLASVHPDLFEYGMDYIIRGFEASLASYRNGTIKRRAAQMSVDWLHGHGDTEVTLSTLPIRHT